MRRRSAVSASLLVAAALFVLAPEERVFAANGAAPSERDETWIRGIFTGHSPRPELLPENEAWRLASRLAQQTPGAFVIVGGGESMRPLYTDGAILVCRQVSYTELTRGMTALYRSKENQSHVVAHVLIAKARDGWRAAGLNNRGHDMEPVVADNLVGVVIAAFTPAQTVAASFHLN